jgi:hypothetical protein
MIQPIMLLGAAFSIGLIIFRYKIEQARKAALGIPAQTKTRTRKQQLKTAKVLFGALIAFMAISYALQRLNHNLSGSNPEPSLMERIVLFLDEKR